MIETNKIISLLNETKASFRHGGLEGNFFKHLPSYFGYHLCIRVICSYALFVLMASVGKSVCLFYFRNFQFEETCSMNIVIA
jgi:hypothetical protein